MLYWLNPQEQWARAYAQFIAVRSEDGELLRNIEKSRDLAALGVFPDVQWEYDDFVPIAAAIAVAFQKLGRMP